MTNKKWCLLKRSDGSRGLQGKKKVYEVTVAGRVLTCEWGMAEKPQRQRSVQVFASEQAALGAAYEKVWSKRDRGYEVAYQV